MIIAPRHFFLDSWGQVSVVYGSGSTEAIASASINASAKFSGSASIAAAASTSGSGYLKIFGEGSISAIADFVGSGILVLGGGGLIQCYGLSSLVGSVRYDSGSLTTNGIASTYAYGINVNEAYMESYATASTNVTVNYIAYVSDLTSQAICNTQATPVLKKICSGNTQAIANTSMSASYKTYLTASISGSANTSCLGARLITSDSCNIMAIANTEATGSYGLGLLTDIFVNNNGQLVFQEVSGRFLYFINAKICVGNASSGRIKYREEKLILT